LPVEAKPLFRPDVLRPRLAAFVLPPHVAALRTKLQQWSDLFASKQGDSLKEKELLADFLALLFCDLLGYTRPADGGDVYTISRETHVEVDGKFADAVLGRFTATDKEFVVAVEGKGPRDPLDLPFAGRKMSAVDQCYRYAINLRCDWLIVTSMRETRLYSKAADQRTCERFDLDRLASDEQQLKKLVFLLGAERVVPPTGRSHLYDLQAASEKVGRELTKQFYARYGDLRQDALEHLSRENPGVPRNELLGCTQKLLDRILFCAFCEDRELLPVESIRKAWEHRDPYHPRPIWENFRGLFRAINEGNSALSIPPYNGGLFAADPLLDSLVIPDAVCTMFRDLAEYDYRSAGKVALAASAGEPAEDTAALIDVDILGHIFEQSITDLERLRDELEGRVPEQGKEKHKSRRKKEGAFYTPAFITRYIVEQTLGGVLADRFEALRRAQVDRAGRSGAKALADPAVYDLDTLRRPQREALVRFWEAWQDDLAVFRVLDPACGSGAFLIEAFDQLHAAYRASNDRLEELRGHRTLFDLDRQILQNNLYGVDLNDEAIEICQLSLWIKTAQRGKVLTSLDHTIRVGNSVVSDAAVHRKAFDWHTEFPEVFAKGGFDVVVANPPYIRQEWLAPYKPHWQQVFRTYHGVADIFTYFYECGVNVLRPGGRLGFITSGSWVRGNFGAPLREFLASRAAIESLVDFGEYQPFEDAEMIRPTITIARKDKPGGDLRLFKWLTSGSPPENLSDVIASAPVMRTDHLGAEAWELDPDEVLRLRKKLADSGTPLRDFAAGLFRGVTTGLNEVFVINGPTRDNLIANDPHCGEIIKRFVQGTNLRPWYVEDSDEFLIFTRRGIRIDEYPAVRDYLAEFREKLEPKPGDWPSGKKWPGRKAGAYEWYEIQDTVDYWSAFEQPKIVWSDISKLPRFSMDTENRYLGNTGYIIPGEDYYLLGVLSSWASWFSISKTAQPLRLRADRWQYRLIAQFMENIPIPEASGGDRDAIANLARSCSGFGSERYALQTQVQKRLTQAFGEGSAGETPRKLNNKASSWWDASFNELGTALKASFHLAASPFRTPRIADEWESYLAEKRTSVETLTRRLADAEAELNDRVYQLFQLTPREIRILQREVEH
jgi:hypothetical protein